MAWQLFPALDDDWRLFVRSAAARAAHQRWQADPDLAPFPDLEALVGALRGGAHDPEGANRLLAALVAWAATDDVALRSMLQALLPGLVNVAKRVGHGRVDEELEADVLVEAVQRIRCYPLARRPRAIAANVLLDVLGRLARDRARHDRAARVGGPQVGWSGPDPSLELTELVCDAMTGGQLRWVDAELLLSIAVGHETLRGRAEREGMSYAAVDERWRRARDRLRRAVAPDRR